MIIDKAFLEQNTVVAAKQLLGCHLIRKTAKGVIRIEITETEAYRGSDDPASHASRAVTPRNRLMFGDVGQVYVYLIYGMHLCMNIVAHEADGVGAILLRAGKPLEGIDLIRANRLNTADRQLMNGPGKLARALEVDLSFNGYDLLQSGELSLYLEYHKPSASSIVRATPRIGISKGIDLPWRFVMD
ncbi:MAG TPA: DNA-3-methyladenine glycosylase [Bacilli bacterium]